MRISKRDLEALRIGIKEQARKEIDQENWERTLDKAKTEPGIYPPQAVELVQACQLEVGDILASTNWGYDFREVGIITEIRTTSPEGGPIAGDIMIGTHKGSFRALNNSDTVLRKCR